MTDAQFKAKGLKFTWVSGTELAGTVLMFLLLVPFAISAYANYNAGSHYRAANDFYLTGNFVGAKQVLDKAIEARPELYHPHEMLAMSLYLQREPAQAEAEYRKLATMDLDGAADRKPLAQLAVLSLQLIQLRATGKPIANDQAYGAAAEAVKALAERSMGAYLDAKVVHAQVEMDRLSDLSGAARRTHLEAIRKKLDDVDKALAKPTSSLSPWGVAVLYNSLGVVNYELGTEQYAEVELKSGLSGGERAKAYDAAAKDTAAAVRNFRKSLQMKLMWTVPHVNFEQAMAFKLVERGLPLAERKEWIDYANDYVKMRDEHLGNLAFGLKLKLDKEFDLNAKDNDYTLKNSIGWACSLVGNQEASESGRYHSEASSKMRDANRVNNEPGVVHYNLARTRANLWKQYVGLEAVARKVLVDAINETRDTYKGASEHGGATRDPLRRCRLFNNMGVFWFKGLQDPDGGIRYLETAKGITTDIESSPLHAGQAERQGLSDVIRANLQAIYQHKLDDPKVPENEKKAIKEKLESLR